MNLGDPRDLRRYCRLLAGRPGDGGADRPWAASGLLSLHWSPWGVVTGAVLGLSVGLVHLIYLVNKENAESPPPSPTAGGAGDSAVAAVDRRVGGVLAAGGTAGPRVRRRRSGARLQRHGRAALPAADGRVRWSGPSSALNEVAAGAADCWCWAARACECCSSWPGGWSSALAIPYFQRQTAFWLWLLVVYPVTLALDVALILAGRPAVQGVTVPRLPRGGLSHGGHEHRPNAFRPRHGHRTVGVLQRPVRRPRRMALAGHSMPFGSPCRSPSS